MSNFSLVSTVVFLPLVGVGMLLLVDRRREAAIKHLTFAVSVLTFLVSLQLYRGFQLNVPGMQFVERKPWIAGLGVQYFVGVDGISLLLVLLTTFLTAIAILSSYTAITTWVKEYMICMLLLETGMLGVFVALDLVLFYVFWEGMLIPMYFLIGVWGGPRRIYATLKFFLYTMAGPVGSTPSISSRCTAWISPCGPRSGCSWPSPWPSPSRSPCSPSTRGCRMPTWRRPRPAR